LVIVIGLYDLMGTTRAAAADPQWRAYYAEGYVAAALLYFIFTFSMSRYSLFLEQRLQRGRD
jgi:general L-amino acid transport system permease protein